MKYFIYLHYFLVCVFGCKHLPRVIDYGGDEWYSVCGYEHGYWFVRYFKYVGFVSNDLFEVRSRYRHLSYIKMMCVLWKMRNKIEFGIE